MSLRLHPVVTGEIFYCLDFPTSSPQPTNNPTPQQQPGDISPPAQEPTQGKNPNKWLIIGLIVFALVILGIAGVFAYQNYQFKRTDTILILLPTPTVDPTVDWKIYSNEKYGFQISYPSGYYFTEGEEEIDPVKIDAVYFFENKDKTGSAPKFTVKMVSTSLAPKEWLEQEGTTATMSEAERIYRYVGVRNKHSTDLGDLEVLQFETVVQNTEDKHTLIQGKDNLIDIASLTGLANVFYEQIVSTFKFID